MTSVAVYNDPSSGYAKKYTYRQSIIDRLKLQDAYAGLTDEQVFDLQCTNSLPAAYSIFDDSLLPADICFQFSSYDHGLADFVEDSAQKIIVIDAAIADYLASMTDATISVEPSTDVTDNATVAQLQTLKAGQLTARCHYCNTLITEPDMEIYDYLYWSANEWNKIPAPVLADLTAMPIFKEFVITDNGTTAGSVTTVHADDSATRLIAEVEDFMTFSASVHGFRDYMMRDIMAAATTGALLAIDTMDIITYAESL